MKASSCSPGSPWEKGGGVEKLPGAGAAARQRQEGGWALWKEQGRGEQGPVGESHGGFPDHWRVKPRVTLINT